MCNLRRLGVLVLSLSCVSSAAFAQFPKIKIPKGIPGKPTPSDPTGQVQRARAGTPGVVSMTPSELTSGKSSEITLTVSNFTLQDGTGTANGDKVALPGGVVIQGYGVCRNLTNVSATAPDKIKFTINPASGSTSCNVGLHSDNSGYLDARFNIIDAEAARQKEAAEKQQRDMMEQQRKAYGVDKANFGKLWAVKLGNKSDTWTYVGEESNGMARSYKTSAGDKVQVIYYNGNVQIQVANNCILQGQMEGNEVNGMVMQCPGMQMGDRWSATIK
jgi:hypothetical protein